MVTDICRDHPAVTGPDIMSGVTDCQDHVTGYQETGLFLGVGMEGKNSAFFKEEFGHERLLSVYQGFPLDFR